MLLSFIIAFGSIWLIMLHKLGTFWHESIVVAPSRSHDARLYVWNLTDRRGNPTEQDWIKLKTHIKVHQLNFGKFFISVLSSPLPHCMAQPSFACVALSVFIVCISYGLPATSSTSHLSTENSLTVGISWAYSKNKCGGIQGYFNNYQ